MWNATSVPGGTDGNGSAQIVGLNTVGAGTVEQPDLSRSRTRCKRMKAGAHGSRLGHCRTGSGRSYHELSFQKGRRGASPHRQMPNVIICPPQ